MATAFRLCLSKGADFTICYAPVVTWLGTQLASTGDAAPYRPAHQVVLGPPYYGSNGGETDDPTHDG
jgi:hypothetical protein